MTTDPNSPGLPTLSRWASAFLGACGLVSAVVLVLALTRIHRGVGWDQMVTFYLIPAATSAGFFLALRASAELRVSLALLVASTVAAALLAEGLAIGVAVFGGGPGSDSPSIGEAVDSMRLDGIDAYPTIPGNILVDEDVSVEIPGATVHPLSPGPAGVTAILCDEWSRPIAYQSDRYGFNNPDEAWDSPETDIVLVGDSYVHGVCVPPEAQIASLFRRGYSTLNLGSRGAGPLQELGILREYGSLTRPKAVVWIYYEGNDRYDGYREANRPWLTAYLDAQYSQALATNTSDVSASYKRWIDGVLSVGPLVRPEQRSAQFRSELSSIPKLSRLRSLFGFGVLFPTRESRIGPFPSALARAAADVASWGGQLHVVYLPSFERFRTVFGEGVPGKGEVLAAAAAAGVPVTDLEAVFAATGAPKMLWAHPRGHLNEEGYALVAETVLQQLVASGLASSANQ